MRMRGGADGDGDPVGAGAGAPRHALGQACRWLTSLTIAACLRGRVSPCPHFTDEVKRLACPSWHREVKELAHGSTLVDGEAGV